MNPRLIGSTKRLVALLKSHADDLDQLADASDEPERSEYRRKAEVSRSDARDAEMKLEGLEGDQP